MPENQTPQADNAKSNASACSNAIWKYQLQLTDEQSIMMPLGATILSAENQNGTLCIWVHVDTTPDVVSIARKIRIYGTGNPVGDLSGSKFAGTVLMGQFVWHVFAW